MRNTKKIILLFAVVFAFASCKKGDTGPAGANGTNGNANVTNSTFTVATSSWVLTGNEYDATLNVPSINQSIIDKGAVNIYVSSDGITWTAMPFSVQGYEFNYNYSLSTVKIAFSLDSGNIPSSAPNNDKFKVVVIASSGLIAHPNVNLNNYNDVKAAYQLQD